LTGDEFSPETAEFQQLAMGKVRDSKWLKKNAGKQTRA